MKRAIFNTTTRIVRKIATSAETPGAGESHKDLTDPEYALHCTTVSNGGKTFVEAGGLVRAATPDEAEDASTVRSVLLSKIKAIAVDANKPAAYQLATAVLLALDNGDRPGAIACVNASALPAAQKTKLVNLINRS